MKKPNKLNRYVAIKRSIDRCTRLELLEIILSIHEHYPGLKIEKEIEHGKRMAGHVEEYKKNYGKKIQETIKTIF